GILAIERFKTGADHFGNRGVLARPDARLDPLGQRAERDVVGLVGADALACTAGHANLLYDRNISLAGEVGNVRVREMAQIWIGLPATAIAASLSASESVGWAWQV